MFCYACSASLQSVIPDRGQVPRYALCPNCSREVKVCLNCFFHDSSFHNQCRENSASRVADKEKANFCEFFKLSSGQTRRKTNNQQKKTDFNNLFK